MDVKKMGRIRCGKERNTYVGFDRVETKLKLMAN